MEHFDPNIKKLYIEPSTLCNLDCTMCMRRGWKDEELGHMDFDLYKKVIVEIKNIPSIETVFFGGVGEPTFHPDFVEMVKLAHDAGKRVECVSNGTLLDYDYMLSLAENGLDMVWVSVDGFSKSSYENIRKNGDFATVRNNLLNVERIKQSNPGLNLSLGITFVAMKSNLSEMGDLMYFARAIGASDVKITHILPYSKEAVKEAIYARTYELDMFKERRERNASSEYAGPVHLDFPMIDINDNTYPALSRLLNSLGTYSIMGEPLYRKTDYCRFVQEGNVFIRWDGQVTQCMALLHQSQTYLREHERILSPYFFGNVKEQSLLDIWNEPEYETFRNKVRGFEFSMCTQCTSCDLMDTNKEDCLGNTSPTCGACLWAQGFIQCP